MSNTPKGLTAIYIYNGRVIATASDFERSRPGGFTVREAQTHRVELALARAVVHALASPALYENLDAYGCEQIVRAMKGTRHVIPIGYSGDEQE